MVSNHIVRAIPLVAQLARTHSEVKCNTNTHSNIEANLWATPSKADVHPVPTSQPPEAVGRPSHQTDRHHSS